MTETYFAKLTIRQTTTYYLNKISGEQRNMTVAIVPAIWTVRKMTADMTRGSPEDISVTSCTVSSKVTGFWHDEIIIY